MKLAYFLGLIALTSCVTSESIVYNNTIYNKDNFKNNETLSSRMNNQAGNSTSNYGIFIDPDFDFTSTFLHTRSTSNDYVTTINLSIKTGISQKKLNPELFIVTDHDTIHITNVIDDHPYYLLLTKAVGTTGTVSINTITSGITGLNYNPSTGTLNSNKFNAYSDYRIKDNVENIDSRYTIEKMRPVT